MHPSNFPGSISATLLELEMNVCDDSWKLLRLSNAQNEKIPLSNIFKFLNIILDPQLEQEVQQN